MNKIFLTIIAMTSFALAGTDDGNYVFYVETPEMVDIYFNIFNGIAKIFQSGDYESLLRLVFLFGGFFVFASGILQGWGKSSQGSLAPYYKYIIGGVVFIGIIFSKNGTIWVKSNEIPTYCSSSTSSTAGTKVDNIPFVLAYGFKFANEFGRKMTKIAETAYAVPSAYGSVAMSDSGGYVGALRSALHVVAVDPNKITLDSNTTGGKPYDINLVSKTLFAQCILIPFSAKGAEGMDEIAKLKSSKNLFGYLSNLYDNDVEIGGKKASNYTATLGGEEWKCGDLWNGLLKPYISDYKNDSGCGLSGVGAGALQLITGQLNPPKSKFQEVAVQAGLVNTLSETQSQLGIGTSGIAYSSGKTRAEFIQTNIGNGAYMAEILPYLQMTIRAILYAFLPFVFVIILLPGGFKVLTQYLQTLIWVELWTPTAAILNMFMVQEAQNKMGNIYADKGITAVTSLDMLSSGATIAGVAGYLYLSVPALTWLIMKGSAYMLSGIGNAVAGNFSHNIQTDTVNRDVTEAKRAEVMSNETGEEFGMAESSHYSALQTGAIAGATLGVQHNAGMANVVENEAYRVNKGLKSFQAKKDAVGTTGEGLASLEGVNEAMKSTPELNVAKRMTNDGTTLNSQGAKIVEQDTNLEAGKANAKLEMGISEQTATNAQKVQRGDIIAKDAQYGADTSMFGSEDKAAQSRGVNASISNKEQDTDKRIKGEKNADGTANKAGVEGYQARATNAQLFSIDRTNATAGDVSANEAGKSDAAGIIQNIGSQKATGALNKDGSVNHEGAENYGSLLGHNAKDMANITRKVINTEGVGNMANAQIAGIEATNAQVNAVGGQENYNKLKANSAVSQQANLENTMKNVRSISGNETLTDKAALEYYNHHQAVSTSKMNASGNMEKTTRLNGKIVETSQTMSNSFTAHNFGPTNLNANTAMISNALQDTAGNARSIMTIKKHPAISAAIVGTSGISYLKNMVGEKEYDRFKSALSF